MILTAILFLGYAVFIHGKPKHKFNIIQPDIQSQKKSSSRNLEEYDTYMVLYFKKIAIIQKVSKIALEEIL